MKKGKTFNRKEWILIIATLLIAGFAICVGLGVIEIGEFGIKLL